MSDSKVIILYKDMSDSKVVILYKDMSDFKVIILYKDMSDSKVIILYKDTCERNDCNNYRGISLLSFVGKLFALVMLIRLQKLAENVYPE